MTIQTIFFDLDDTLYPSSSGLWDVLRARMELYMLDVMHMPAETVAPLRQQLTQRYGTTMRGLQALYQIDPLDYLEFVHAVNLNDYLRPDPQAREVLLGLPQRRLIFTNADRNHAMRVLDVLGLSDCFERVIDVLAIAPYCKPQPESFDIALRLAGVRQPETCLLLDDAPRNLEGARAYGLHALRFGEPLGAPEDGPAIASLVELPAALAALEKDGLRDE